MMREPLGSLTLPPFHEMLREWEQSPYHDVLREWEKLYTMYLLFCIHLAALGERSSLDDQSVPRTGEHSEPYMIR